MIDGSEKCIGQLAFELQTSMFLKSAVKQNNLMPLEIKVSALFMMCFMLMEIDSLYLV